MTQLSWQPPTPPAVTKCGECEHFDRLWRMCEKQGDFVFPYEPKRDTRLYHQNKDGITKTCPMWIEQNKETPNANT